MECFFAYFSVHYFSLSARQICCSAKRVLYLVSFVCVFACLSVQRLKASDQNLMQIDSHMCDDQLQKRLEFSVV